MDRSDRKDEERRNPRAYGAIEGKDLKEIPGAVVNIGGRERLTWKGAALLLNERQRGVVLDALNAYTYQEENGRGADDDDDERDANVATAQEIGDMLDKEKRGAEVAGTRGELLRKIQRCLDGEEPEYNEAFDLLGAAATELTRAEPPTPAIDAAILELRQMHRHIAPKCEGGCPTIAAVADLEAARARVVRMELALRRIIEDAPDKEPEYEVWGGDTEDAEAWGLAAGAWAAAGIAREGLGLAPAAERTP